MLPDHLFDQEGKLKSLITIQAHQCPIYIPRENHQGMYVFLPNPIYHVDSSTTMRYDTTGKESIHFCHLIQELEVAFLKIMAEGIT